MIAVVIYTSTSAGQHAADAQWDWREVVTEYEHRVMVVDDASTTFHASFFQSSSTMGYIGLQTYAHPRQMILFSVWDATEAEPGSEGTFCQTFGGEGVGYSCRLFGERLWSAGVPYTLRLEIKDEWVSGSVRGDDGLSVDLGRIRSPGQMDLGRAVVAFVENWALPCRSAPRGSTLFYDPKSGEIHSEYRANTPVPDCAPMAKAPYDGGIYIEIGGDGAFGSDDRARIDRFLGPPVHTPMLRRPWLRGLLGR